MRLFQLMVVRITKACKHIAVIAFETKKVVWSAACKKVKEPHWGYVQVTT